MKARILVLLVIAAVAFVCLRWPQVPADVLYLLYRWVGGPVQR